MLKPTMNLIPYVIEKTDGGERSYDIFSRLLKDRIIMLTGEVNDVSMAILTAQLLFLNNESKTAPIYIYIDSPGGVVTSGCGAIDTMNFIKAPVYTIVTGVAASMGAAILSCGTKRYALPNATVMTHQSIGGTGHGTIQDARVEMKYWEKLNERLSKIIAKNCGMTLQQYTETVERNNWMFAEDALKYGIIDEILISEDEAGITLPDLTEIENDLEAALVSEKFKKFCEALHLDM